MTGIVGILNITPDSFSDGGNYHTLEKSKKRIIELFEQGADMIDIGAESTRPYASSVEAEVEWERLRPLIEWLKDHYDATRFSIDTRHGSVARQVISTWSSDIMISDVSGVADPEMLTVVKDADVAIIVGHLPAESGGEVSLAHSQKISDIRQVYDQVITRYMQLVANGISPEKMIVDPGIGFGKTPRLNHQLIGFAALLPSIPVMIGYSRKRFLGPERLKPERNAAYLERVISSGAAYVRVHDVAVHYAERQECRLRVGV